MPPLPPPLRLAVALALVVPALAAAPAARAAAPYDFVVLASSLRAVQPAITIAPSIDDTGEVAFVGYAAGGAWVLAEDEPGSSVLADYRILDGGPDHFFAEALDDTLGSFTGGWVAYRRTIVSGPPGPEYVIARSDGVSIETLYAGPEPAPAYPVPPAANAAGRLVFFRDGIPDQIVSVEQGIETVLFQTGDVLGDGRRIERVGKSKGSWGG